MKISVIKRFAAVASVLILLFSVLSCVSIPFVLRPQNHKGEVELAAVETGRVGSPYSYEHKTRGDLLRERGEFLSAVEEFESAVDGDPHDYLLRLQLAEVLVETENYYRARLQLARAIMMEPASGAVWTALAKLHMKMGEEKKAEEAALHGVKVDSFGASAPFWLGHYYFERDMEKALYFYLLAKERDPVPPKYLACARAAHSLEKSEMSKRLLMKYVSLPGEDIDGVTSLAHLKIEQGDLASGVEILEKLVANNVKRDELRERLIEILLELGLHERAVTHIMTLGQAVREETIKRAEWLIEAGRAWEARRYLVEREGRNPSDSRSRYMLARIEAELGRVESALLLLKPSGFKWPEEYALKVEQLKKTLE